MNIRRTLPLRSLAVCNSSALTSSVNSILLPPRILFLEHYTTPGQFSFRKSLSVIHTAFPNRFMERSSRDMFRICRKHTSSEDGQHLVARGPGGPLRLSRQVR